MSEIREADNQFKIPRKQWKKWNEYERQLFESLFEHIRDNRSLYLHPASVTLELDTEEHWETTAWNAAWMAADFMKEMRKNA